MVRDIRRAKMTGSFLELILKVVLRDRDLDLDLHSIRRCNPRFASDPGVRDNEVPERGRGLLPPGSSPRLAVHERPGEGPKPRPAVSETVPAGHGPAGRRRMSTGGGRPSSVSRVDFGRVLRHAPGGENPHVTHDTTGAARELQVRPQRTKPGAGLSAVDRVLRRLERGSTEV